MKEQSTILYISDAASDGNSVLAALEETGCEVVSTDSPAQGLALLYVMRTFAAVVLDNQMREQTRLEMARSLRQIRPDVPVILLCGDQLDVSLTNECASTDELTSALQHFRVCSSQV